MKRMFLTSKRSWCCLMLVMLMAFSAAGCGRLELPFELPVELPFDVSVPVSESSTEAVTEVPTETVPPDYSEKPGQEVRYVHSYPVGSVARYDLNGDGVGEDITVVTNEYEPGSLTIGDSVVEIDSWTPTGYFTVLNVDDSVNRLFVGISDYGPSDDPETALYAYDGVNIHEVGYLWDILGENVYGHEGAVCHGDGTVTAGRRWDVLGTWGTKALYRVTENGIEDITDFYPYIGWDGEEGWSVTARYDLIMYESELAETITVVPAGSDMEMTGLRRGSDEETFWVAFQVPAMGKELWLVAERVDWASYVYTGAGFISSEEAFEGFFYAG